MTTTEKTDQPLVLFHDKCRDGFCAAWVIWNVFKREGRELDFIGAQYGANPEKLAEIVKATKGREVIVVDFSYPRPVMKEIATGAKKLLVLDHHRTAEAALKDFAAPNALIIFDMERSGAGLAWDYFHDDRRPAIVDYVEDRDLWRFALPLSKAYDFAAWDEANRLSVDHMAGFGKAVQGKIDHYVDALKDNARRVMLDGHSVPCVNAPQVDISELLGALALECRPDAISPAPFVVGWWQRGDGKFQYSLRSVATPDGGFDVSEIAKKHGGGGHRNAAGFESAEYIFSEGLGYALDESDRAELEWWRKTFSTRFQPGNLPKPGRELADRRFSLYQDISDGTKVKTHFGI